ncbi:membrane protease subunit, stomatin/prohibitin [Burkholderiales bacterium JOSHI_001]|nr:membrane protease subunit, stomatin/prohibitin [Burkholderiales bacterium JOSHI_001]
MNLNPNALSPLASAIGQAFSASASAIGSGLRATAAAWVAHRRLLLTVAAASASAWVLVQHPPLASVPAGDVAVRTNQLTGGITVLGEGPALKLPALHEMRHFTLRDQVARPVAGRLAAGPSPFQSVEGLSLGVDLSVRYAVDAAKVAHIARSLPAELATEVVEPAMQAVTYKTFARYTVREIFSSKRAEIQQGIEAELKAKLAADGIVLKSVQIGQVDLPADYRRGMDGLLAEELATEKMRYTLELKEKQVKQTELEALADKARRETSAAAAASEQVIAAKAQEEAMRHVLPFKQKQIEQRQLEAEAEKGARIKQAEASGAARKIEAAAEAESRQKLADAEVYRLDRVGKVNTEQMAREGALLSRHPLLIQKTVADKLSDKVQVIIAPPGTDGRFIASGLIGRPPEPQHAPEAPAAEEGGQ